MGSGWSQSEEPEENGENAQDQDGEPEENAQDKHDGETTGNTQDSQDGTMETDIQDDGGNQEEPKFLAVRSRGPFIKRG